MHGRITDSTKSVSAFYPDSFMILSLTIKKPAAMMLNMLKDSFNSSFIPAMLRFTTKYRLRNIYYNM